MKRRNIFPAFDLRPDQAPGSPDASSNERRQPLPQPEPGRRYLRYVEPPQLSGERWDALADSQARALELIKAGEHDQAVQALRAGTWRNPEEELRKLLIRIGSEADVLPTGKAQGQEVPEASSDPDAVERRSPLRLREAVEQILAANAAARSGRRRSQLERRMLALDMRPCWPPGSTGYGAGASAKR